MMSNVNMLKWWKNILPNILPIIGEFSGSIVMIWQDKDHDDDEEWQVRENDELVTTYTIRCNIEFTFLNYEFGDIRVVHYMDVVQDGTLVRTTSYADALANYVPAIYDKFEDSVFFEQHNIADYCLKHTDWRFGFYIRRESSDDDDSSDTDLD